MNERICIFGAGAVGSYIGGHLTKAGHDVTIIDMWGSHVTAMNQNELIIHDLNFSNSVKVNAIHFTNALNLIEKFDIILICVKSFDTEWASHYVKNIVKPDGIIISAQNCMNDKMLASIVGHNHAIGMVMSTISVALWEPAVVKRGGETGKERGYIIFRIGELHGRITERVHRLVEIMNDVDTAIPTSNIWGERWSKLASNASSNPVQGMTGLASELGTNPDARRIQTLIAKEVIQVGLKLGFDIEPFKGLPAEKWANADDGSVFEELDELFITELKPKGSDHFSSMAQDTYKKRHSEIQHMNGFISNEGKRIGIQTPANDAVTSIISEIDSHESSPSPKNIQRALQMIYK